VLLGQEIANVITLVDMSKHHPAWMYDEPKDDK
jgi:hypothetical protein